MYGSRFNSSGFTKCPNLKLMPPTDTGRVPATRATATEARISAIHVARGLCAMPLPLPLPLPCHPLPSVAITITIATTITITMTTIMTFTLIFDSRSSEFCAQVETVEQATSLRKTHSHHIAFLFQWLRNAAKEASAEHSRTLSERLSTSFTACTCRTSRNRRGRQDRFCTE